MKPEPQLYYTAERCQRFKAKCMVQAATRGLKQKPWNFDLLVNDKTHNLGTFWCLEHGVKPGGLQA
jgi:hypothetical protein